MKPYDVGKAEVFQYTNGDTLQSLLSRDPKLPVDYTDHWSAVDPKGSINIISLALVRTD